VVEVVFGGRLVACAGDREVGTTGERALLRRNRGDSRRQLGVERGAGGKVDHARRQ
jgi:hypothetical protein